jgi:ubiquitin-like-conjugating enzyme ATG3
VTRSVPCTARAEAMERALLGETEIEITRTLLDAQQRSDGADTDNDEGWLLSHVAGFGGKPRLSSPSDGEDAVDDFDFVGMDDEGEGRCEAAVHHIQQKDEGEGQNSDDNDEYGDMGDFEDDNILGDEEAVQREAALGEKGSDKVADNIKRVRTYDISITYDKYYQTPRVWIFGYKEDGNTPLSPKEMFQDVMSDYVQRTVTIETHPHVDGPHLSVHPCQHGAVMKNIVSNLIKDLDSKPPEVGIYLFIFLKFVSSIVPTMNYDFTFDVTASTQK